MLSQNRLKEKEPKKKKIQTLRDEVRSKHEVLKREKKSEIKTRSKDYTFLTFSAKI